MSRIKNSRRTLTVLTLAGVAGLVAVSSASAFSGFGGGGFGGGHGGGGFGGGHGGGFGGGGYGGGNHVSYSHGPMGGYGGSMGGGHPSSGSHWPQGGGMQHHPMQPQWTNNQGNHPTRPQWPGNPNHRPIECFRAPCNIGTNYPPHPYPYPPRPYPPHPGPWYPTADCRWNHSCEPRPVSCRYNPYLSYCHWHPYQPVVVYRPPVVVRTPVAYSGATYVAPTPAYVAPTPAYSAPVAAAAPAVCEPTGTFVQLTFQPTVTSADITAFLKSYNVTMADGPSNDGVYRIKLSTDQMASDQYGKVVDSMRSQTNIVSAISG